MTMKTSEVTAEVWLLNMCSLCGFGPLVRTERDASWHQMHVHAINDDTKED